MAFLIPIEINDTGAFAEYWRLTHVQVDRISNVMDVQVHGYLNEQARNEGKFPLDRRSLRIPTGDLTDSDVISVGNIYLYVRANLMVDNGNGPVPMFSTALDV